MYYNYFESPVGILEFAFFDDKLHSLFLVDKFLKAKTDNAFSARLKVELLEYFSGQRKCFSIPLSIKGTAFQEKVWVELLKIPYGKTCSYKDIASLIRSPNASRAVGTAISKNPIMILVPCHRVISSSGKLSGYACGTNMKSHLQNLESKS